MPHKQTIEGIVKKVDRKIASLKESEFYRIDFPPPGHPFDINAVLAYEISPNRIIQLAKILGSFLKTLATALVLFFIFFLLFNAPAYYQILKNDINHIINTAQENRLAHHTEPAESTEPPEQELMVLSKDPIEQKQQFPELDLTITPPDNRIIIPSIGKNIPITEVETSTIDTDWTSMDDDILEALKDGVVRYPGTALPGEEGNTFITGHSSYYLWDDGDYKDVFALLPQVEVGEQVIIYYNQQKYTYQITEKYEVSPSDVDVLAQPDGVNRLTLMTCTPVGMNIKRLILIGEMM